MTLAELKAHIHQTLDPIYPKSEINAFYFILLQHYGKFAKAEILAEGHTLLPYNIAQPILQAIRELRTAKPLQYILGETEFFSNRFLVNENVLIPRPETEELVAWALDTYPDKNQKIKILDIGTGSGCIAISLAKALPNTSVTAIDVSPQAIAISQQNAQLNEVKIKFLQQNILLTEALPEKYDLIISNPPYVREVEKTAMHNNVLNYEPHLALFVPDENPLLFYEKITSLASYSLMPNGSLFFEINQTLGAQMQHLCTQKQFTHIELRKDLFGNDRMLRARL